MINWILKPTDLGYTIFTRLQRFQWSMTLDPIYELQLQ
jgi:hypothetical protein